MPHHNRARLAEINEKGLNPNKKYVTGKHGNLVDPLLSAAIVNDEVKSSKEVTTPEKTSFESSSTNSLIENLAPLDVETTKEKESSTEDLILDKQEKISKQEKKKAKAKTKTNTVLESKS